MHIRTSAANPQFMGVRLVCAAALASLASTGHATPALSYYNYSQVYGRIDTSYSSPYLGDISFTVNGTQSYSSWDPNNPNAIAAANYSIAPAQSSGVDPVYDLVTANGNYGFGYSGQSQVTGASLHAKISTTQVDRNLSPVPFTPNSSINAYADAQTSQQFYIGPSSAHPAGSYGAILVGLTLEGSLTAAPDNYYSYSSAYIQASTSFTDTAGVDYQSTFSTSASSYDLGWTGSATVYKKLLFQYGTVLNISNYLWLYSGGNATADFLNTGKFSSIELPLGATLDSGADQAGLGSQSQLYGVVFNATTADDENTNWDFGNNGGGFTPSVPVPEPSTGLLLVAGVGVIGWNLSRRRISDKR